MKSKTKLFLWLYMPQNSKVQFDPYKSSVTRVEVECTFKKVIRGKHSPIVDEIYIYPRINKKLTGIVYIVWWEG